MANEEAACERSTVNIAFRFTDARHLKFVEAFSREPCLWNRHPYLWGARVAACKRIQNVMNETLLHNETPISLQGIKMKIKNIRSVYHQELKKMRISPYYYPKSCWFEPLHKILAPFLDKRADGDVPLDSPVPIHNEKTDDNKHLISAIPLKRLQVEEPEAIGEEKDDDEREFISPIALKRLQVKVPRLKSIRFMPNKDEESTEIKIELNADPLEFATLSSGQPLRMMTPPLRNPSPSPPQIVNVSSPQSEQREPLQTEGEDEFTFFGMSVAAQLRRMPLSNAMIMQSKIQYMISMERRKLDGDAVEANFLF
ncbi:uncharacterized protein LOC117570984 [Drosophila albomicans]|uniref:Uncharacterized protein LOC117570984 n=1 Tax=Drosophila albomicans TaxID=7291 RepID=A0A6P8WYI2_DROAB|nr:uncharacterized protein LOC117570984 [Drosophila albomicans]